MCNTPAPAPRPRAGFSLIELLTSLVVVGLLAAIAMATINRLRESSLATKDASNLRQLAQASLLYANDNSGALPSTYGSRRSDGIRVTDTAWWLELFPNYISSPQAFTSPMDNTGYNPTTKPTWQRNGMTYPQAKVSYGAVGHSDANLDFKPTGRALSALPYPSRTALYTNFQDESKRLSEYWFGQHPRWLSEVSFVFGGNTQVNVAFVDGHVALMDREQIREGIQNKTIYFGTEAP